MFGCPREAVRVKVKVKFGCIDPWVTDLQKGRLVIQGPLGGMDYTSRPKHFFSRN
ncbi:hypothetical protein WH47_10346 [Habropoda laboriosa]|uniref:Uncharacterized protein n=1 Tax=Habropoda laboriosa TaxID=597456 RepID=A0A0L7R9Z0_9HYME|nr:hypothetical protein WH47_10346 [Habropoda laboriosa]